ncbi:MAG: UvrD-helicase domain-containing protein [Ruminococcus sp.]|jgi:DNA helicase-2/ATP-dependent DNA helicase PcrA|nr:UvrD-helicase domain-containing protein [Ruminococcus sp.]
MNKNIKDVLTKVFDNLNEMQREAVISVNGPVLILAGAGSGKTTALINRIACMILFGNAAQNDDNDDFSQFTSDEQQFLREYDGDKSPETLTKLRNIIASNPIPPWRIAAVTFTNKAAGELKERLSRTLGTEGNDVCACTFHSFCMKILRRDIGRLGYSSRFAVYDSDDSNRLIKNCLNELNIDEKFFPAKAVQNSISSAKDKLLPPEEFLEEYLKEKPHDTYQAKIYERVYKLYQSKCKASDAVDFDDIIMLSVKLLEENPDLKEYYSRRYTYMMVDEFQDTNAAQYRLAELICKEHRNLCVVGDDDQSIYKFRGAAVENILQFHERFDPKTIVIKLEQNYRSTKMILTAANSIIANNPHVFTKELFTENEQGEPVKVYKAPDGMTEAKFVAEQIKSAKTDEISYSDFAILYRMNAQSNSFERALSAASIPYRIIGGLRFYDRKEIKDILAYLQLINNPRDILHFRRAVNEPKRGIGEVTVAMIEQIASDLNVTPEQICAESANFPQLEKKASLLGRFEEMMGKLRQELLSEKPLEEFLDTLLVKTGYKAMLTKLGEEGETRLENIGELRSEMFRFRTEAEEGVGNTGLLADFLESISLYTDVDKYEPGGDTVNLLTVHSAKGLEWDTVFLVGMEEGIFPSARSLQSSADTEEDRRLAYVAVTRAKKKLFITRASERVLFGSTQRNAASRFLREIDKSAVEVLGEDGSCCGNGGGGGCSSSGSSSNSGSNTYLSGVKPAKASPVSNEDYSPGERIIHPKFGGGMVLSAVKMGNDSMLEIVFDEVGTKKLMAAYAKLKKE